MKGKGTKLPRQTERTLIIIEPKINQLIGSNSRLPKLC